MPLQQQKPTSPGRRFQVKVITPNLHKGAPQSGLTAKLSKSGGRNNAGRITTRHKGGGYADLTHGAIAQKVDADADRMDSPA